MQVYAKDFGVSGDSRAVLEVYPEAPEPVPACEHRGGEVLLRRMVAEKLGVRVLVRRKAEGPAIRVTTSDEGKIYVAYDWNFYSQWQREREAQLQLAARVFETMFEVFAGKHVYVRGERQRPVHWDILSRMGPQHGCWVVGVFETHSPNDLDALFEGLVTPETGVREVQVYVQHCPSSYIHMRPPPAGTAQYTLGVFSAYDDNDLLGERTPETKPGCVEFAKELLQVLGVKKSDTVRAEGF